MSLLTRCPACATLYRVVPDQLRISEGWVKCGQCGDIFDASKHLIEAECEPEQLQNQEEGGATTKQAPALPDAEQSSVEAFDGDVSGPMAIADQEVHTPSVFLGVDAAWAKPILDTDQLPGSATIATPDLPESLSAKNNSADPEPMQLRWDDALLAPDSPPCSSSDSLVGVVSASFLTRSAEGSFWQKTWVKVSLWCAAVALCLLFLGQWVHLERDRLAAQHPELKPALTTFCELAQCQLAALKRIESLSVDSVGFNELGQGRYRLSFSVRNSGALTLAFPLAELTLTDGQDQAVFRRVFSAAELGTEGMTIASGVEWPVLVTLHVPSEPSAVRVLGYRLLVFYP
jgi:predicted Zn finger-like uncharacterized protein